MNRKRCNRLICKAITAFGLSLEGITVLTEVGSGPYVTTPLIAALAGAERVYAIVKDSRYGRTVEVINYLNIWAEELGVSEIIYPSSEEARVFAQYSNLVTNLGFVRPIDAAFIKQLPKDSAISLMWEPWEFREQDIDLTACRNCGIPVLGTNENHPNLGTFKYVALTVVKLLLECEVEVNGSLFFMIGDGLFEQETKNVLHKNGAQVISVSPDKMMDFSCWVDHLSDVDALILMDHRSDKVLVGEPDGIPIEVLVEEGIPVIHICGSVNTNSDIYGRTFKKYPAHNVPRGYMTVATDYVGPKPVIDLHAAGLKVGQELVNGMRVLGNDVLAKEYCLKTSSVAMDF